MIKDQIKQRVIELIANWIAFNNLGIEEDEIKEENTFHDLGFNIDTLKPVLNNIQDVFKVKIMADIPDIDNITDKELIDYNNKSIKEIIDCIFIKVLFKEIIDYISDIMKQTKIG